MGNNAALRANCIKCNATADLDVVEFVAAMAEKGESSLTVFETPYTLCLPCKSLLVQWLGIEAPPEEP